MLNRAKAEQMYRDAFILEIPYTNEELGNILDKLYKKNPFENYLVIDDDEGHWGP